MTRVPHTTPYAWPYDGCLDPTALALVVTGWDLAWASACAEPSDAIANIEALREVVQHAFTVGHAPTSRALSPATTRELPSIDTAHVDAAGVDGFYGSPLDSILRRSGITTLLIGGLGFETTVHSTLRTANDMGLECLVVTDASAAIDPTITDHTISMIEMSGGIFGAVGTTDHVVATLTHPGGTP